MRVDDIDASRSEKFGQEGHDPRRRMPGFVDYRHFYAEAPQLSCELAFVEEHRRQPYRRAPRQVRGDGCDLHFGACPEVGGHDVPDPNLRPRRESGRADWPWLRKREHLSWRRPEPSSRARGAETQTVRYIPSLDR